MGLTRKKKKKKKWSMPLVLQGVQPPESPDLQMKKNEIMMCTITITITVTPFRSSDLEF
jgi:hypothetical protein